MATDDVGKPLRDFRVLVTRPWEQAQSLADALTLAGATAIVYPTIGLAPPPTWTPFEEATARLASYQWVVFTSPAAVRFACDQAQPLAGHLRLPGAASVAAVGDETARALGERGVPVALVPADQRQEGLVTMLGLLPSGTRVLFPQALGGRELLRQSLQKQGVVVDVVPVYQTSPVPLASPPPSFDVATFASPSALRAFVAGWTAAALDGKVVAVIGPTTAAAAAAASVTVHVAAPSPSVSALVSALAAYLRPGLG